MAVPTTEVVGHQTEIPGLLIFDISSVFDERGYFQEKYQKAKLVAAGLPEAFTVVQNSLSYNKERGVTRGIHAEPWDKYITVVAGQVFCAFVDLRQGGTFGTVVTVQIDANKAVFLPQGVGNSFQTLQPETYYLYSVNRHWSAESYNQYCFVNLNDPKIAVDWPVPLQEAIVSERDRRHPNLTAITPLKI